MLNKRTVLLVYLIVGVKGFYLYNKLPHSGDAQVCRSKICELDAARLQSALNTSVDPCDDFYKYACGNWALNNKRPSTQPTWSQWEPVIHIVQKRIQNILEDDTTESEFQPLNAAKQMYQACMNAEGSEDENLLILHELLKSFNGWPMVSEWVQTEDWSVTMAKINALVNVHPLLKFHVATDMYNSSRNALYIDHPSLIFPQSILSSPSEYKSHILLYEKWIVLCAQELGRLTNSSVSTKRLKQEAHEIVQFEIELAKNLYMNENETSLRHLFKQFTLDNLQLWTDFILLNNIENSILWNDVMKVLFLNVKSKLQPDDLIIIRNPQYIIKLIKLVDRTAPRVIANYFGWTIVKQFGQETTQKMKKIFLEIDKKLLGVQDDVTRQQKCVSMTTDQMGLAIGYQYVNSYFDLQTKKDVEKMVENIRYTLITKLKSLEWLDEKTKFEAIEKTRYITHIIGYPDWMLNTTYINQYYKDLKLTKNHLTNQIFWNEFSRTKELSKLFEDQNIKESKFPTEVNAFYSILQNLIVVPAAFLQYPFFTAKRLKVLNYAAVGTIIGHEISHAFDNTGSQVDKNGNLRQWWSEESFERYENNLKCFHEHYSKFTIQTIEKLTDDKLQINGEETQDENIADVIGLELAYHAFRNVKNLMEWKLPGLETLSADQLFFLNFANQWCETSTSEHLLAEVLEGEHTPSEIRVLGALSNSVEFNKAFGCPENSAMNPKRKCKLW